MAITPHATPYNTITAPTQSAESYTTWIEINAAAFNHNVALYASLVRPALFAPVIKSNAYGHGFEIIAQLCEQSKAVDYICVVSLSEAIMLRSRGISKPILVLSILDAPLEYAIIHDIDIVAYDIHDVKTVAHHAQAHKKNARIHVKIDTGLSRLGLLQNEAVRFIKQAATIPSIIIQGIFTHCAISESANQTFTNLQLDQFDSIISHLESCGIAIPLKHASCSAAATVFAQSRYTMARAGIGIYGLWPSQDNKVMTLAEYPHFSLKPVMTWKTRVIQVKEIPAGSFVGYNLTHQTKQTTQVAVLPVGYWDGFDRRFSNRGMVLVNGQSAPVIGIVAMNMCMIDVTGLNVRTSDEVTLLGDHAHVSAEALAQRCNTINYEIVTRINPLISRVTR